MEHSLRRVSDKISIVAVGCGWVGVRIAEHSHGSLCKQEKDQEPLRSREKVVQRRSNTELRKEVACTICNVGPHRRIERGDRVAILRRRI